MANSRVRPVVVFVALLLAAGVLSTLAPAPVAASTFTVTDCSDNLADVNSLRYAVNNLAVGTASSTNTITITASCPSGNPLTLTNGTLLLTQGVTINGPGASSFVVDGGCTLTGTVCTGGGVRVFTVTPAVTATLTALTIQHGYYGGDGGGIYNNQATLTVTDSTISNNAATGLGAGIENYFGTLTVTNSTISNNTSTNGSGGGIQNNGGTLTVTNSTISNNTVSRYGGGIYNNGTLHVTNATIDNNTATSGGGGIINSGGTLTVTNTTLSKNAAGTGGGIDNVVGPLTVTNSLIVNSTSGGDCANCGMLGSTNITGSFTFADAMNTPANHGGPTATLALPPGSPAIGTGDPTVCANTMGTAPVGGTDQRGIPRPAMSCDIGAFQDQGFTFSMPTGNNQTTAKNAAFATPLGLTISGTNGDPVTNGAVTFTITPGPTGASATFPLASGCTLSMSNTVALCPITGTGASGMVTSPALTANGTPGRFSVIASTAGVPTAGNLTYTLAIPTSVTSIIHTTPSATLTNAASVTYTVTFADPLSGLTAGDFTLTTTGSISGASVGMVSGSGTTWTVTVNTGTGDGTLRLDFTGAANDTNPPAPAFTSGDVYTIDKTAPTLTTMPAPLPAATVGQAYSASFTASDPHTPAITGATGLPMSFMLTPGAMANTATLTGTPTNTSPISFTMQAQDALGNMTSQPYTITVAKAATTTSVTASPSSVLQGVSVTLTATIAGSGTGVPIPTGSVTFTSGSAPLGTGTLDGTGKASVMTTALPVGMDAITASYSGDATFAASMGSGSATVTNAALTGLTVTAPTGSGSGNSGTASMPKLAPGQTLTLTVMGSYTNGMMGSVSGLTYMSSDPTKVSVDASGTITAIAPGSVTIMITAPNGVTTTIVVTVTSVPTGGLTNPNAQPMAHATVAPATAAATPVPQPQSHPASGGSGVQPHAVSAPTATPDAQPVRH